jgi:hypothetical protein
MGFEYLATQIVLIGSRHHFLRRRESPLLHYTILKIDLTRPPHGWEAVTAPGGRGSRLQKRLDPDIRLALGRSDSAFPMDSTISSLQAVHDRLLVNFKSDAPQAV